MTTTRRILIVAAIAVGAALAGCSGPTITGPASPAPTVSLLPGESSAGEPITPAPHPTVPSPVPTTPTSTPPPAPASPGVSIPFHKDYSGDGIATVWTAERTTTNPSSYGSAAKNGGFLILDVSVEAVSVLAGSQFSANPFDWTVKDAVGHSFQVGFGGNKEPALHDSGPMVPGDIARGFIVFDVPTGALTVSLGQGVRWAIPAA